MKIFALIIFFFCLIIPVLSQSGYTTITLTDNEVTVTSYSNSEVIINGKTDLHLTSGTSPLTNSIIKLNSEDSWVFFDNIRPNIVISSLLQYILVNNQAAVQNTNVRVAIYRHGTAVIPHSSAYQPLEVFSGTGFTGTSQKYSQNVYSNLGSFDNTIRSFRLKRGYMATLAGNADGTGYSRVFIADNADLPVPQIPMLDGIVSYIRVMNWEWVTKKGWCQTGTPAAVAADKVNAAWFYSWSADQSSSSTLEYVPIRQNGGWPAWTEINGKTKVTHLLGFNEPDHTEQSNLTVPQALEQWPEMMKTGLRIGSPACTSTSWLYQFMDSCKARNYRVDFVAWHAYWGGKTPQNWYNDLKAIHDRTGRPLWITEWNNGANWTTESWPDNTPSLTPANAQKQLTDLTRILQVLDTAQFIERYAIYNWVQDRRAIILADTLTPAGKYYASNKSAVAFNRINEVIPTWNYSNPVLNILVSGNSTISLTSSDPNGELNRGYILERKINSGEFSEVERKTGVSKISYSEDATLLNASKVRYRIRTLLPDGNISGTSNEVGFDMTEGKEIQYGKVTFSNVDWNNIFFKQPYTGIPVIIFGSPTNINSAVYLTPRVKQNTEFRFSFQFAPWAYQNVKTLSKDESVHYLILNPGKYSFGNLKALVDKSYVNPTWTRITFSEPFDTIPVVFATQLTSSTSFATGIRIKNVTKTGFEARIQKESKISAVLYREMVSWFAITPGKGILDGKEIIVGKTKDAPVSVSAITSIEYGDTIENPLFYAQMQTCNDDTVTASLRCQAIYGSYARVLKQREKSLGYTSAANEEAGWMVINPLSGNVGMLPVQNRSFSIFPNPVSEYLYFSKAFSDLETICIYNLQGVLVKKIDLSGSKADVSDLPAGYYLLKTSKNETYKFIKL